MNVLKSPIGRRHANDIIVAIELHSAEQIRAARDAGAKGDIAVRGITWGKGLEWETTLFDVTPISYAQCGLLPQMHRAEVDIYDNIRRLVAAAGRPVPPLANVPNRYLNPKPHNERSS